MNSRGPLTATGIYQMVARRGRQCGVTVYPHRFRHHFSHSWLDRGGAERDLIILGMLLGSMLVAGAGRWIVPFPVFLVLLEIKIRIEEQFMLAEIPDDYPRYRHRAPRLVPGLHLISGSKAVSR